MYYFIPRPDGTPLRLYGSTFAASLLTPPATGPDGRPRFELAAPVAVDLVHDPAAGEVVNEAGAWAAAVTVDPEDGALVIPAGTAIPAGLVVAATPQDGWRDAPAPERHYPRGRDFDPRHAQYLAAKAAQEAAR